MDIDNQSEDGEIKKSPSKDMDDFRYIMLTLSRYLTSIFRTALLKLCFFLDVECFRRLVPISKSS